MPQVPTNFSYMPTDAPGAPASPLRLFANAILRVWQLLTSVVNGGISFGNGTNADNINGVWETVTFTNANTNVTVTHNLGRVPVGYIIMSKSVAGDVFTGSIPATTTQITLQNTTAGAVVSMFII